MAKRTKHSVDPKSPNPTNTKRMGRSRGPMVFNDHVGIMVTQKIDEAIKNNKK